MVLRRVVPSALVNENRVVLEGQPSEPLPPEQVYISPALTTVQDGERGDTLEDLPQESYEVPKTTWFGFFGWGRRKQSSPSQSIEVETAEKKWFELPEEVSWIRAELLEIKRYFPEVELFQDDSGSLVWKGNIEGLGEVEIHYPENYPRALPRLVIEEATKAEKAEILGKISELHSCTPAVALVVAMKCLLARRISNVVSNSSEKA
jgi:hypothetical protein